MEATLLTRTIDGVTREYVSCNGHTYPKEFYDAVSKRDMAEIYQEASEFKPNADDVFLAAFCRSGTHWTWEIMNMLVRGNTEYQKVDKNHMYIDFPDLDIIASAPTPRVLTSHHLPSWLPKGVLEQGNKIVHVQRNVKDVTVSLYEMLGKNWPDVYEWKNFDVWLKYVKGEYGVDFISTWPRYVKAWETFTKDHPDQILNINYEDLVENPVREIKKINDFLQCNRSEELIQEIAEACCFTKMRTDDIESKQHLWTLATGSLFRKGVVGDWKSVLTVAQNEYIDRWLEENMVDTELKFRYEL